MQYKLQASTFMTNGIAFEYNFDCVGGTHHRAIDLARAYAKSFADLLWLQGFMLFVKEADDWKPLAKITLERQAPRTLVSFDDN